MDSTQEILHWLSRNDLQELADRFQHHKINTLRRLYSLNMHLIRELIPEIGLRTDFMECWTQFKLRGTLREGFEITGTDFPGRSNISFPASPRIVTKPRQHPVEIVELQPTNQNPNVGVAEYSARPNMPYIQRVNGGISDSANRSTLYNVASQTITNQQPKPIELVEIDTYQGFSNNGDRYCRNALISIHDPRSVANNPDENPFEMILGHSSEDSISEHIAEEKSNALKNVERCTTITGDQVHSKVHSEEKADSGWGSSPSPVHTIRESGSSTKKSQQGVKRKKTELSSDTVKKRQDTCNSYDKLRTLDMQQYLINFDVRARTAVENYKSNGFLVEPDRSAICNAVAKLLMKKNQISAAEYHMAAQKICEIFPNESEVLYYCPPDITKKKPSGKLVNKVKNIKHVVLRKKELQM